jgi:hypothetical protein
MPCLIISAMNAFPAAPDPEVRCLLKAASCEEKEKQSIETALFLFCRIKL